MTDDLTDADHRALRQHAAVEECIADEDVAVDIQSPAGPTGRADR